MAWATDRIFSTPECVGYVESRERIYISNYNRFPVDLAPADDFISVLDMNGEIIKLRWITG
jgi:hypothetical protein